MTTEALLVLLALLTLKHFVADGPLQTDAQVVNKGRWLHPDGLAHAGLHAALSAAVLGVWAAASGAQAAAGLMVALVIGEFVVHYAIDYGKCRIDDRCGFARAAEDGHALLITDKAGFFSLLLADQALHALTYVAMVAAVWRG